MLAQHEDEYEDFALRLWLPLKYVNHENKQAALHATVTWPGGWSSLLVASLVPDQGSPEEGHQGTVSTRGSRDLGRAVHFPKLRIAASGELTRPSARAPEGQRPVKVPGNCWLDVQVHEQWRRRPPMRRRWRRGSSRLPWAPMGAHGVCGRHGLMASKRSSRRRAAGYEINEANELEDTMAPTLAEVQRGTKGRRGCRRRRWSQCAPRALVEAAVPVPVALKCLQRHCLGACRFCRWLVVADA